MPSYWKAGKVVERNGQQLLMSNIHLRGDLGPHCADHRCSWVSDNLCDYPVGDGKTCDRPLCGDHAHEVAPDTHYCAPHYAMWEEFKESGGVRSELENVVPYRAPSASE